MRIIVVFLNIILFQQIFAQVPYNSNNAKEYNTISFTYQEEINYSLLGKNTSKFTANASGSGKVKGEKDLQGLRINYAGSDTKDGSFINISGSYNYSSNCTELKSSSFGNGTFKNEWLTFSFEFDETTQTGWASLHCEGDGSDDGTKGPTGDYCLEPRKVIGVDAGNCTKSNGGYIITVSDNIETRTPMGSAGEEVTIRKYSFTAFINTTPLELDAVIKPLSSNKIPYEKWMPEGELPDTKNGAQTIKHDGNSISFGVSLINQKTKEKYIADDAVVIYELIENEITNNTGSCINYPLTNAKEKLDLEFDEETYKDNALVESYSKTKIVTKPKGGLLLAAVIKSNDFAAYGKLKATIIYKGRNYEAHTDKNVYQISIPLDENNNKIADCWEKDAGIFSQNYAMNWDDEHVDNNNYNGDGLTIYEEYRGILSNGKHVRLNPKKKDLIIANDVGDKLKPGFNLLETAAKIIVTEIKKDELDIADHVININHSISKQGNQHAVLCVKYKFPVGKKDEKGKILIPDSTSILGIAIAKKNIDDEPVFGSPKDVVEYRINQDRLGETSNILMNVPHEIGHCCGLQHHGKTSNKNIKLLREGFKIGGTKPIKVTDMSGNTLFETTAAELPINQYLGTNEDMYDKGEKSEASGDVRCFMIYNNKYEYEYTPGFYIFKLTPLGEKLKLKKPIDLTSTHFCKSIKSTEWNNNGKFGGDGDYGNCFSNFRIKDY